MEEDEKEILRLASPVAGSWRIATRDVTISGKNIKNGDKIMLRFAAGSRDSEKFNQPNEMDINRQNSKTHYAFGRGIHTCVGNMLARREISICLEHMINMFETIDAWCYQNYGGLMLGFLSTLVVMAFFAVQDMNNKE